MQQRIVLFGIALITGLGASSSVADEFASAWPAGIERVWVGPGYFANRLTDWRVKDGRLECLEGSRAKPMRTTHLLTRTLAEKPGAFAMSVRTGPIEAAGPLHADTWTGFLIGVGGAHVDHRISVLCHHWPGADGGLIAALDGTGKVVFRDNSNPEGPKGPKRGIPLTAWRLLETASNAGEGFAGKPATDVDLRLVGEPGEDGYRLTLIATEHATGELISESVVDGVDPAQVSGNVALVSHQSPKQRGSGYWFRDWRLDGSKVEVHDERRFGPVLAAQHTLSRGVLKMTAQLGPLGKQDTRTGRLEVRRTDDESWRLVALGRLIDHSYTIPFRVENWDSQRDAEYRIAYDLRTGPYSTRTYYYHGRIRKDPIGQDPLVIAAFTGHHISAKGALDWNHGGIWYPHNELVAAVTHHKPDLLFFSGDQIYEGGLAGIIREPAELASIDYLYHWLRWCWAFGDLARDVPCICIPDDHDVYHGNVWGAGGKKANGYGKTGQDTGGYTMDPLFVNAVQRTQTSHLPDPYDPTPVLQGITVYYTDMNYGGISFAIVEDRKWKDSPTVMVPEGGCINGWFEKPGFDPATQSDRPNAKLLGARQLEFLDHWAADWQGAWMKVMLSQTIFANIATLPKDSINDTVVPRMRQPKKGEYLEGDKVVADGDSNGWPQTGRNKALRALRRGFALHLAGDQHLGSFIRYGVDEWDDAGYALCVPSIANVWPRRWFPPEPGRNRKPGSPKYTGEFKDGFGNHITVHAVSNPGGSEHEPSALYDRAPGYGIVRLSRSTRDVVVEVWPRWIDPSQPGAEQYPGWPITINQFDNYGRKAKAYLPTINVVGMADAVVGVIDEADGEIVYTVRIKGSSFRPKVFKDGVYRIEIGEPGTSRMKTLEHLTPVSDDAAPIRVEL